MTWQGFGVSKKLWLNQVESRDQTKNLCFKTPSLFQKACHITTISTHQIMSNLQEAENVVRYEHASTGRKMSRNAFNTLNRLDSHYDSILSAQPWSTRIDLRNWFQAINLVSRNHRLYAQIQTGKKTALENHIPCRLDALSFSHALTCFM